MGVTGVCRSDLSGRFARRARLKGRCRRPVRRSRIHRNPLRIGIVLALTRGSATRRLRRDIERFRAQLSSPVPLQTRFRQRKHACSCPCRARSSGVRASAPGRRPCSFDRPRTGRSAPSPPCRSTRTSPRCAFAARGWKGAAEGRVEAGMVRLPPGRALQSTPRNQRSGTGRWPGAVMSRGAGVSAGGGRPPGCAVCREGRGDVRQRLAGWCGNSCGQTRPPGLTRRPAPQFSLAGGPTWLLRSRCPERRRL